MEIQEKYATVTSHYVGRTGRLNHHARTVGIIMDRTSPQDFSGMSGIGKSQEGKTEWRQMNISEKAQITLDKWRYGTNHEKANAAIKLSSSSAQLADEVVRLHEQLGALAKTYKANYSANPLGPFELGMHYAAEDIQKILDGENDE